jgi:glycine/D-amino acid oxidase-like deaminating enzyme
VIGTVTIVGAGVVGMVAAHEALARGYAVNLIDASSTQPSPGAISSISWQGSRMVRDETPANQDTANTKLWRRLLDLIGYGEIANRGITHISGQPRPLVPANPRHASGPGSNPSLCRQELEQDAFVLDTTRVRRCLMDVLHSNPNFELTEDTLIREIDPASGRVQATDERSFCSDLVLIAAGTGTKTILRQFGITQPRTLTQVCAVLKKDSAYGQPECMPAFIHHDGDRGAWGTPATGPHPPKVSASDLCFRSLDDALRFTRSRNLTGRFFERTRQLLPELDEADVSYWSYGSYPDTDGNPIFKCGPIRAQLACNGGAFKRAPLIASILMTDMNPL